MSPLRTALLVLAALGAVSASEKTSSHTFRMYNALQRDVMVVNKLVDDILSVMRHVIIVMKRETIQIPDNTFNVNRFHIKMTNTWAGRLSTLQRTSDAQLDLQEDVLMINASFGLQELGMTSELGIASQYGFPYINREGNVDVTVGNNSMSLVAMLRTSEGKCEIAVDSLQLEKLDGLSARVRNFGLLTYILNDLISKSLDAQQIGRRIQQELERAKHLMRAPCPSSLLLQHHEDAGDINQSTTNNHVGGPDNSSPANRPRRLVPIPNSVHRQLIPKAVHHSVPVGGQLGPARVLG